MQLNITCVKSYQWLYNPYSDCHYLKLQNTCTRWWYLCGLNCTWWRHQMETFSALLALCAGNSPVPVNSPHKGQWRGALMFSLICPRINDWINNREAGDLRRYRGHYDVIVMISSWPTNRCPYIHKCIWRTRHVIDGSWVQVPPMVCYFPPHKMSISF